MGRELIVLAKTKSISGKPVLGIIGDDFREFSVANKLSPLEVHVPAPFISYTSLFAVLSLPVAIARVLLYCIYRFRKMMLLI